MVPLEAIPAQEPGFKVEELDGETILYRDELKKMIYLNDSASAVWHLCDGQRSVREIIDVLADVYSEVGQSIALDVKEAIDNLTREGALRIEMIHVRHGSN